MIDIFGSIASNDQSVYFLGRIFGIVGDALPPSMFPGGKAPIILSNLFQVLNSVALTVGVIVITYTTVMGLFYTAQDGEFLGRQKWNKIWVPLRTVIGVAGLFPSANGYCAIQVFLMWIVLQGISAADLLWTTAVNTIQRYGNPVTGGSPAVSEEDVRTQIKKIFQGMVCQQAAKLNDEKIPVIQNPRYDITYYCNPDANKKTPFCLSTDVYNVQDKNQALPMDANAKFKRYNFGPEGACGFLEYADAKNICAADSKSLLCKTSTAQEEMMKVLFADRANGGSLNVIAKEFVTLDAEFSKFYETDPELNDADPAANTPAWVRDYCTAPTSSTPRGLGISADQCCVFNSTDDNCMGYQLSFKDNTDIFDISKISSGGLNSPSDGAVTNIYLPFGFAKMNIKSNFIDTTTNAYMEVVITKPTEEFLRTTVPPAGSWFDTAIKNGWLMAGSYYLSIAKEGQKNIDSAPHLLTNVTDTVKDPKQGGSMSDSQRNLLKSVNTLLESIEGTTTQSEPTDTIMPRLSSTASTIRSSNNFIAKPFDDFIKSLSKGASNGDPIISAMEEGQRLMKITTLVFAGVATGVTATAILANINFIGLGTGPTQNPLALAFQSLFGIMSPFLILLLVTLFSVGALLGVYVPLIPYIVFTVTSLGWFIGVIELMVAAPFIALGIMAPGGQSEILGHAEKSLMMVFNLFLRPSLMIVGMIAAMMLSNVAIDLLNAAFSSVIGQIGGSGSKNVFVVAVYTVVYTLIFVTLLNKCFTLIHMLPERALMYIGGQQMGYGEEHALQQVKGGVEGSASQMASSARTASVAGWVRKQKQEDKKGGLSKD